MTVGKHAAGLIERHHSVWGAARR